MVSLVVGWEWIVIILALIVLLLWGPSKIPELARGLGQAKAEFDKASKGEYLTESRRSEASRSSDDDIILIARSLGITTEGKTRAEIFQEIIASIKASKALKSD